jgi:hypothetical protein
MVALSLTATPQNQSILCNVNYSGSASEFIIFYFTQGSTVIYSESSPSPNNIIISNLTNGVINTINIIKNDTTISEFFRV